MPKSDSESEETDSCKIQIWAFFFFLEKFKLFSLDQARIWIQQVGIKWAGEIEKIKLLQVLFELSRNLDCPYSD